MTRAKFLCRCAEHTIGIIVGCMPVLPAFFRHIALKRSEGQSGNTPRSGWKASLRSGTFGYRNARRIKKGSNDSYLLNTDYRDLDDPEHGPVEEIKGGTTTMINGGGSDISIPQQTVEGLHGSLATSALVSKSIQVESHPRTVETLHVVPQPAYLKK